MTPIARPPHRSRRTFRFRAPARGALAAAVLACVLSIGLGLAGCGSNAGQGLRASGQVEATEVRLASKVQGNVVRLAVEEGDSVRAGQALVTLDSIDVALARAQARGDRDQARADLALLTAGSRVEDVRAALAEVDRLRADLDGASKDLARMQALLDSGAGAVKPRDDARVRRDMAQASLHSAEEARTKLVRGARPQEIAAARAALDRAQARLDQAAQQVNDCDVRSPLAGVVTSKLVEVGELVTPGMGLLVLTDLDHPWATVFVGGADLPRLRIGARAHVVTDAKGDPGRDGHVSYVSPTAEFTPRNVQTRDERARLVYRVKVLLPNADHAFKPGMPVDVTIDVTGAR
jgi:HlyD family secretion protein